MQLLRETVSGSVDSESEVSEEMDISEDSEDGDTLEYLEDPKGLYKLDSSDEEIMEETAVKQAEKEIVEEPKTAPIDLSDYTDLIHRLESAKSGHKLLKTVVKNSKELCKITPLLPQTISTVDTKVLKFCQKCTTDSVKRSKFLENDIPDFSCDGNLFKTFLKNGMKNSQNGQGGSYLISLVRSLFSIAGTDGKIINPVLGIQMLLSHSKAEEIFLEAKVKVRHPPRQDGHDPDEDLIYKRPRVPMMEPMKYSEIKTQLIRLWLALVQSFCKISKLTGTEGDKKILENSVPYLLQMYGGTLSLSDRYIFDILKLYTSNKLQVPLENMPLFGPKCFEPVKSNPLYAHSIRANTVLGLINENKAFETGMKFDEESFNDGEKDFEQFYDLRFLLPLVCHVLDEKNICDSVKVMSNGWIHFIMRGLALDDAVLRSVALLAYKRLVFNLHLAKGFRLQDVKIWIHFLMAVKRGMVGLEECRLSNLLSTWMVATCEILKQPAHPMYPRVTHFLLAKPTLDVGILPDFIPFYNAVDGNKESREWILNILVLGLKNREDWRIAQKLPTIKFLCCSFSIEKIGTQRIILNILASGARIPEVAQDMVDRHSLLLWIANVPVDSDKYYRRELEDIFRHLMQFCPLGGHRNSVFKFVASKHNWICDREVKEEEIVSMSENTEAEIIDN